MKLAFDPGGTGDSCCLHQIGGAFPIRESQQFVARGLFDKINLKRGYICYQWWYDSA